MLMNVRFSRTRGGVRVVTSTIPHVQSVAMGIWAGVGSRHEPAAVAGISHFAEHLLFKGTKRRSARAISNAIEGHGGDLNAFTGEEHTCYFARVACDKWKQAFDVLADMYRNARFAPADIAKERGVILEEIAMYRDQPRHQVQELLMDGLWPAHPLGRPIVGNPASLARLTRSSFRHFVRSAYGVANTVVAFAGQLDHEACVALVESEFRGLETGTRARLGPRVPARPGPRRTRFETKDAEQAHLALGLRVFGHGDERRHALKLLSTILGESMSSRLFQVVREKHGLAYSVGSGVQLFADSGALSVSAGLDPGRQLKALVLIMRELARLRTQPVGARELRLAKDYVIGQLRMALESTSHQMMWAGENILVRGCIVPPEVPIAALEQVTSADILKLARSILRPSAVTLAVISPELTRGLRRELTATLAVLA